DEPGSVEGESDPVAPPDGLAPGPPHAASSKLTVPTRAANRHLRRSIGVLTSLRGPFGWRAVGREIGEDETDQDSLPMPRPADAIPQPADRVSQAEQHTDPMTQEFIYTQRSTGGSADG